MRIPTMTTEQAESELGPRGHLLVNEDNRRIVRKWLVAQGYPAAFAATCTNRELSNAYNETDGTGLAVINRKLKTWKEALAVEFDTAPVLDATRINPAALGAAINDDPFVGPFGAMGEPINEVFSRLRYLGHVKRGAGRARGVVDTCPCPGSPGAE